MYINEGFFYPTKTLEKGKPRESGGRKATGLSPEPTGCGYFMHPERRGQPKGNIDAGVAVLDGLGLLLFLIPGIIAFVVDFSHNTIYLPPGKTSLNAPEKGELLSLEIPGDQLTEEEIERIVSQHLGYEIDLDSPDVEVYKADNIDEIRDRIVF